MKRKDHIDGFRALEDNDRLLELAREIGGERRRAWELYLEIDAEWAAAMAIIRERELTNEYIRDDVPKAPEV